MTQQIKGKILDPSSLYSLESFPVLTPENLHSSQVFLRPYQLLGIRAWNQLDKRAHLTWYSFSRLWEPFYSDVIHHEFVCTQLLFIFCRDLSLVITGGCALTRALLIVAVLQLFLFIIFVPAMVYGDELSVCILWGNYFWQNCD